MDFMGPNREQAEKVFIVVENSQGAVLEPGKVVEWTITTTDADQGKQVELTDAILHTKTGIGGHKVAGVVNSTINDNDMGRLQVYGAANVRANNTYDSGTLLVAGTGAGEGTVASYTPHSDDSIGLLGAIVGWQLEPGPNATNATVMLNLM
tara:strand:+ start:3979 stop:4431 length:453 start_codon:yes stop_codon:yes gene_type:complete